jgi:hypothetical protein
MSLLTLVTSQLAAFFFLTLVCYAAGALLTFRIPFEKRVGRIALSLTTGLGVVGTLLFLIGLARLLYLGSLLVLTVIILSGWALIRRRRTSNLGKPADRDSLPLPAVLIVLAPLVAAFVLTIYPPAAFDELNYHLPFAKLFASRHAVVFAETLRFPLFPLLAEMHFATFLLAGHEVGTHLVQLLATIVVGMLLYSASAEGRVRWWASALWIGNPIVIRFAATAYIDIVLSLFVTGAWLLWIRWRERGGASLLAASAMCAGFAAGTKYLGLYVVGMLMVLTAYRSLVGRSARPLVIFTLVTLAALSPWYIRNYAVTGNPTFPYFGRLFGRSDWPTAIDRQADSRAGGSYLRLFMMRSSEIVREADEIVRLPHALVFYPGRERHAPPLSPWMPFLLPFAAAAALADRRLRPLAPFLAFYILTVGRMEARFLLPMLPFFCLAAASGTSALLQSRNRILALVITGLFAAPGMAYGLILLQRWGPPPTTPKERTAFTDRFVPSAPAVRYLNGAHGTDYVVYACCSPEARYFAEGRFLGDVMGPYAYSLVLPKLADPATLRGLGATHLLLDQRMSSFTPDASHYEKRWTDGRFEVYAIKPSGGDQSPDSQKVRARHHPGDVVDDDADQAPDPSHH